jgi:hypothetical protein
MTLPGGSTFRDGRLARLGRSRLPPPVRVALLPLALGLQVGVFAVLAAIRADDGMQASHLGWLIPFLVLVDAAPAIVLYRSVTTLSWYLLGLLGVASSLLGAILMAALAGDGGILAPYLGTLLGVAAVLGVARLERRHRLDADPFEHPGSP